MMKQMLQRGFTLIELLVVIAIIGILAAVVLASLGDARDNGRNASIQTSMNSWRNQMELLYNANNFNYQGQCANTSLDDLEASITTNGPATSVVVDSSAVQSATQLVCNDGAGTAASDDWAASAPLNNVSGTQQYFCVDGTGVARQSATPLPAGAVTCP